jgi:hypothetical protein
MDHEPTEEPRDFGSPKGIVRRPTWQRVVLLVILVLLTGIGFYFANLITIEHVRNR